MQLFIQVLNPMLGQLVYSVKTAIEEMYFQYKCIRNIHQQMSFHYHYNMWDEIIYPFPMDR